MSNVRTRILDVLFYPIPGLSYIPGISHLTGAHYLRKLEREAKKKLHNHKIQEERQNINIDLSLMESADIRDKNDRTIQTKLFGNPLFNKETDTFDYLPPDPVLNPILAEFTALENLKRNIRKNLRPAMEKQIEDIFLEVKKSNNVLTPKLNKLFQGLQRARLTMVTERTNMMNQRQQAYGLVEAYLRHQNNLRKGMPESPVAPMETPQIIEPQSVTDNLEVARLSESEIDARIDTHLEKLLTLHTAGDELQDKIKKEQNEQKSKIHKRAAKWALGIAGGALTALALREGAALERRHHPYHDHVEHYSKVEIGPKNQAFAIYTKPYINHLSDANRLDVTAHSVEADVNPEHGIMTARIMDIAYKSATGDPNATADLGRVVLHTNTGKSSQVPFLEQSYFVERRLRDVELMLTSTSEHHVFNHSVTSDQPNTPGSRAAIHERNFLISTTCPITIPCGNQFDKIENAGDVVDERSQHIGELSHYPRYSVQIGEACYMKGFEGPPTVYPSDGNHPFPFAIFPVPRVDLDGKNATGLGSSRTAPAFGGNIAGQKSLFPQLSWDNILYATALGSSSKNFKIIPPKNVTTTKTPHTDLSFSENAGFGLIDPELVEKILHNMLYQRTLHPEIKHNPQVIIRDVLETGPATTEHKITLPSNKDVFKITFDIMPPPDTKDAYITITDEYHNSRKIKLTDKQALSRFTDWSYLGTPGSTYTITSSVPIRVGYVAHVNNRGAIMLGLNHLDQLLSVDEIKQRIDMDKLKALPVSMPTTPTVLNERDKQGEKENRGPQNKNDADPKEVYYWRRREDDPPPTHPYIKTGL